MKVDQIPVVQQVVESGAEDRVFDSLLLSGPLLIGLIAVMGRSLLTIAVAGGYLLAFIVYILLNWVGQSTESEKHPTSQ